MLKSYKQFFIIIQVTLLSSLGFAVCDSPICISIENVNHDGAAGTLDIHLENQAGCSYCTDPTYNNQAHCESYGNGNAGATWAFDGGLDLAACDGISGAYFDGLVGGFQFEMPGVSISGASGGSAAANNLTVSAGGSIILGFSLSGTTVPPGSAVLTTVAFSNFSGTDICFGTNPDNNVISNADGVAVTTEWGDCYCNGTVDACGDCEGGVGDTDGDGMCDTDDPEPDCATNDEDECGVCAGPGPVTNYTCEGLPVEFDYSQSQMQAFYFPTSVTLDDTDVDTLDWVGAFSPAGVCVGARKWNTNLCGQGGSRVGVCDIPVMGADGNEWTIGYMGVGDIPTFKIYDESTNTYFDATPSEDVEWGIMIYPTFDSIRACSGGGVLDCLGVCGGSAVVDCNGDCDGGQTIDACGECGGGNTDCLADGETCTVGTECQADTCDACDQCGGNNTACDADGTTGCTSPDECFSDICDACGECGGVVADTDGDGVCDTADPQPNCATDDEDACGECAGDNTDCLADLEACTVGTECQADTCDACDQCGGNNTACLADGEACTSLDECSSDACDVCGECNGTGIAEACACTDTSALNADGCCDAVVMGCDNVCGSGLVDDECGNCNGDGYVASCTDNNSCSDMDCAGVCGGTGVYLVGDDGSTYDCVVEDDADNDGVDNDYDSDMTDNFVCIDTDLDGCDDCSVAGFYEPTNDGPDYDGDGLCDTGDDDWDNDGEPNATDPDDDNDGALDENDSNDNDVNICSDDENGGVGDGCQDCIYGSYDPYNDGADHEGDGLCDITDNDDDNDSILDTADSCSQGDTGWTSDSTTDHDTDGCQDAGEDTDDDNDNIADWDDDCPAGVIGGADVADYDQDGCMDDFSEDNDDDNDGSIDLVDIDDNNEYICSDNDGDTCDDCSSGTYDLGNDGVDSDGDGICNVGDASDWDIDGDGVPNVTDPDDDNDGVIDGEDTDSTDNFVCGDTDVDGCDDCAVSGFYDPTKDGHDFDGDGLCDSGDPDDDNDGELDDVDLDDDNDGVPDATDQGPNNNNFLCGDSDGDGCEDCLTGTFDPSNDGVDYEGDGLCDDGTVDDAIPYDNLDSWLEVINLVYEDALGDDDDDNDGILDINDDCYQGDTGWTSDASTDHDTDGCQDAGEDLDDDNDYIADIIDDCPLGQIGGPGFADYDQDGCMDDYSEDNDDDNDGAIDSVDNNDNNEYICSDNDHDGCDDCSSGTYDVNDDGLDTDGDGMCDVGDDTDYDDYDGIEDDVDPDDDNDGIADVDDADPINNFVCADTDQDGCDDCSVSGYYDPTGDGPDYDGDGLCDSGDDDWDNDGEPNATDPDDDNDGLDGCVDDSADDNDDGVPNDSDDAPNCVEDCPGLSDMNGDSEVTANDFCGYIVQWEDSGCMSDCSNEENSDETLIALLEACPICYLISDCDEVLAAIFGEDQFDEDDGNEGDGDNDEPLGEDGADCDIDDNNAYVCGDTDGDGCEDCSSGTFDPYNDGPDHEGDGQCDPSDDDDDNDGILDDVDSCPQGDSDWTSDSSTDHDTDGCQDSQEDADDDNDNICDAEDVVSLWDPINSGTADGADCIVIPGGDQCPQGDLSWTSNSSTDYDSDGCQDAGEDMDDDNDDVTDDIDEDDNNEYICSDNDGDTCDDCSTGTYNINDDGTDVDGDGLCDYPGGSWTAGAYDPDANCADPDYDDGVDFVTGACGICGGSGPEEGFTCDSIPLEFLFNQSSQQAFYSITSIRNLYNNELTADDWLGVFNGDVCVGARKWDTSLCSGGICDIAAMGDDGLTWSDTDGYLDTGDYPTFKIFDDSRGEYLDVSASQDHAFADFGFFQIDYLGHTKEYSIPLHEGQNLISFYGLPVDHSVSMVTADLGSDLMMVIGEGVQATQQSTGWLGTLTEVDLSSGYWARMATDNEIPLFWYLDNDGFFYDVSRVYDLHTGANLVSFPSEGSFDISAILPDDVEGNIAYIIGEGVVAENVAGSGWQGSLGSLTGLDGYWIFADADISFSYEFDVLSREVPPTQITNRPADLDFIQSSEQAFYFVDESVLQESNIENGDWLVSFCGSAMAGSRQYRGETIDIPVMGYDGDYSTAGYCERGDIPHFKLVKSETGEMIDLYSETPAWESNRIFNVANMSAAAPLPGEFSMLSAYPNPFNPVTSIGFEIPAESMVQISIYNLKGQEIETLVKGVTSPGAYSIDWNAGHVASGVYFVHFTASADGFAPISNIQKLMLVK